MAERSSDGGDADDRILVVDDSTTVRDVVRLSLELEGAAVVEAGSLAEARALIPNGFSRVVLDRQLPDGDGLELLADLERWSPKARVVVFSSHDDRSEPSSVVRVDKGDLPGLLDALQLDTVAPPARRLAIVDLVQTRASTLAAEWSELCRWDPMLPPDTRPALATAVVAAVGAALERPQPLGWGPDPEVERVVEAFAASTSSVDVAVGQLVCLTQLLQRLISDRVPADEKLESLARVQAVVGRAIAVAAHHASSRSPHPSPGAAAALPGRLGLLRALRQELARAGRYGHLSAAAVIMLSNGHDEASHEDWMRRIAEALVSAMRTTDSIYRIAQDRFGLLLPETGQPGATAIVERARSSFPPGFRWAACVMPDDGSDPYELLEVAERRLGAAGEGGSSASD